MAGRLLIIFLLAGSANTPHRLILIISHRAEMLVVLFQIAGSAHNRNGLDIYRLAGEVMIVFQLVGNAKRQQAQFDNNISAADFEILRPVPLVDKSVNTRRIYDFHFQQPYGNTTQGAVVGVLVIVKKQLRPHDQPHQHDHFQQEQCQQVPQQGTPGPRSH
jgi:hypothetical protein